jgi:hypothetical protein
VLVVVLAQDPSDAEAVTRTIASVREQSWEHWQVAVCAPAHWVGPQADRVTNWAGDAGRLSEAVNAAVANSDTDFVLAVRAGDLLSPECLYHVALTSHRDPLVDLVVWDDDRLVDGQRTDPRFRPSWSPDLLTGADYVGLGFAMRRSRFLYVHGVRDGFGDAMTWDLLLRAGLSDERVARVPRVLTTVRRRTDEVGPEGVRAVQEHLDRAGLAATAVAAGQGVRTLWSTGAGTSGGDWPKVTVVIPTRHNRTMLSTCLPTLATTDYPGGFDVVVVDNGGQSDDHERWYAEHSAGLDLTVSWWTAPFNYSAVNNLGATLGDGEVLVFLNDDTEVLDPSWMTEIVGWARRPEIGVAGCSSSARRRAPARRVRSSASAGSPTTSSRAWPPGRPACSATPAGTATSSRSPARASPCGVRCTTSWRVRRALPAHRQRRRARPRRQAQGLPQRLLAVRRAAPPRVGHPRHARAARGLLHVLLALQPVAVRRRPVLLAEPLARQPRPAAQGPARADARRAHQRSARPAVQRLPAEERRGRVADARRQLPRAADRPEGRRRAARRERRAVRGQDRQLVHPRHRQPVLRRHQHRPAHRRPARPRARRAEPVRRLGEPA